MADNASSRATANGPALEACRHVDACRKRLFLLRTGVARDRCLEWAIHPRSRRGFCRTGARCEHQTAFRLHRFVRRFVFVMSANVAMIMNAEVAMSRDVAMRPNSR